MRVKLTAKHPRPAAPERAPVRSGSASARKPVRPARPAAAKTDRPAGPARAPASGPAGAGRSAGDARPPQSPAKRAAPAGATKKDSSTVRSGKPARAGAETSKRAYTERPARRDAAPADAKRPPAARGEWRRDGETRSDRRDERAPAKRPTRANGERERGYAASERPAGARRDTSERTRGGYGEGRPSDKPRQGAAGRPAGDSPRGGLKVGSPVKRSFVERDDRASETSSKRPAGERNARRDGTPSRERANRAGSDTREDTRPSARQYAGRPARADDAHGRKPASDARARKPAASPSPAAAKRNESESHAEEAGMMRLSKRMSELGLCSRREADEWIEKGWVLVDGERIDTLGTKVHAGQHIEIVANARAAQAKQVTILLHKPVGYVSGQAEDGYQPAITLITPANHWDGDRSNIPFSANHLRQLAPAGRLDIDSTGLLVLTQDGRVAKNLIGIHSPIEKEYLVRVAYGERTTDIDQHFPAELLAKLRHGLSLDDVPLRPAKVSWQNGEQLRFVLREGKKRQIRRMCELVGLQVVGLKRIRMGQIPLGQLPQGQWRYLMPDEEF
ncbi:pseudouridine synthase [Trinickia violacea]|uniref:Dual-specificity RNA pseudouridine synthase RluF n=1 Tax=Trinickia violacea TaxID=2571746 RepID=A0A4P8IP26_9BURK|nr:pseudouridine synthase [Trinickia violacea]QCP49315.1 pseudouridine synthase [Trinickia violacea]